MKDFSYYSNPSVEYFGCDYRTKYKNEIVKAINDTPMTAADRAAVLNGIDSSVRNHMAEVNRPYHEALRALEAEFWADAQAELGYCDFLDSEGISALQSLAYEKGHSSGLSEIYGYLGDLVIFAETIARSASKKAIDKSGE